MKIERNKSQPWIGATGRCTFCHIDVELEEKDIPNKELSGYIFIRRWEVHCPCCVNTITVSKDI